MRKLVAFVVSCELLLAAYVAITLDDWLGASRNDLFELVFISLGVVLGACATIGGHKAFLVVPCLYILLILALPFLELSPVKPAVRAVDEIRPGMTESEVRAVVDRHFPEDGRFKRPEVGSMREDRISFALDPSDGRYNAAFVLVKFSSGRCVAAEFLSD